MGLVIAASWYEASYLFLFAFVLILTEDTFSMIFRESGR